MIKSILKKIKLLDKHTLEVIKKSIASIGVKIFGLVAGLGTSIILARWIGPQGLGVINLGNKIVTLVLVFSMLGMDNVIRKETAIAFERKDWQHIANVVFTSLRINLPIIFGVAIILVLLSPWLTETFFNEPKLKVPLIIFSVVLAPQIISRIYASGINGFRKIWQSNLVKDTLSSVVVLIGLLIMTLCNIKITIINAAVLYGIGRLVVTCIVSLYWHHLFKFKGMRQMQTRLMLKVGLPLLIVSSTSVIASSTDTIMLGWLTNTKEVGLYNVALRLGVLSNFFLAVSISTLAPKIASLYADKKFAELEKMIKQITKGLALIGMVNLLVYFFLGRYILTIWGEEFAESYWILIIITIGQFFNVASGSTGVFLMMTGHEKILGTVTVSSVILNIILNFLLIPIYGAIGASVATASTVTMENIIKVIIVKRRTGILTIPF